MWAAMLFHPKSKLKTTLYVWLMGKRWKSEKENRWSCSRCVQFRSILELVWPDDSETSYFQTNAAFKCAWVNKNWSIWHLYVWKRLLNKSREYLHNAYNMYLVCTRKCAYAYNVYSWSWVAILTFIKKGQLNVSF